MRRIAALLAVLIGAAQALAQPPARLASAQALARPGADSARALRLARGAQAEFERIRYSSLPWTDDSGWGGSCDEVIGRFCLTYDDSEKERDWVPPAEPPRLRAARERLLARLDSAAAAAPGDPWIAGQHVRYLVEAERYERALVSARACRAQPWWCRALEGYAQHRAGAYRAAEDAFAGALALMAERDRREWSDLSRLLQPGEGGAYARMRGAARTAAERRFWWLADPLWMDDANDRRAEHLARWVWDRLQDRARSTERVSWGEDLEQISVRFGQPIGWERIRNPVHRTGPASVVVHYASRGREFMPEGAAVRPDQPLDRESWNLFGRRARTDYAPAYVTHFDSLPHQLAVFRRGGEAVLVAGFELSRDSVRPGDAVQAGVVLAVDDSLPMRVQVERTTGPTGAVRLTTALDSAIVSVEALARERRRAGRARYPLSLARAATAGMAMSDVLLLADASARPRTLDDAWRGARSTVRYRAGERVGIFWEVYRDGPSADSLRISVSLARRAAGGLRGVAERIGLAGGGAPVRVRWSEEAGDGPIFARSLGVALPPRLAPGEYLLEVTVQPGEGPSLTRTRSIYIQRS